MLPDHVAGRGWGALLGLGAGATALGSLAAPLLARLLGLPEALLLTGVLAAAAVLVAVPGLRALAGRTVPRPEDVALLSSVAVLAPLPGLCIERLAVAAGRWAVEPGEVVVREGEPGQEFFVVEDGELVVSVDGRERTPPRPAATASARWPFSGTCLAPRPSSPPAKASC